MSSSGSLIQPTLSNVFCQTNEDALIIVELILQRRLFTVQRRAQDRERADAVQSGNVFVFEHTDTGIKRWTDGVHWSPSRILGSFLLYRELSRPFPPGQKKRAQRRSSNKSRRTQGADADDILQPYHATSAAGDRAQHHLGTGIDPSPRGPPGDSDRTLVGSLIDSYDFKANGLVKKTMSIQDETGRQFHMISYYIPQDILDNRLSRPSAIPGYQAIKPRSTLFVSSSLRQPAQETSRRPSFTDEGGMDGIFDSPTDEDDDSSVSPSKIGSFKRSEVDYAQTKLDAQHGHGFLSGNFGAGPADYSYVTSQVSYFPNQASTHGYNTELTHQGEPMVKVEEYENMSQGQSASRYQPAYSPVYTTSISSASVSAPLPLPTPTETLASQSWSNSPYSSFHGSPLGGGSMTGNTPYSIRTGYGSMPASQFDRPLVPSPVTSNYSSTSSTTWSPGIYGTHSPQTPHNLIQSHLQDRNRSAFPQDGFVAWTSSPQSTPSVRAGPINEEDVLHPYSGHWTPH